MFLKVLTSTIQLNISLKNVNFNLKNLNYVSNIRRNFTLSLKMQMDIHRYFLFCIKLCIDVKIRR